MKQLLNRYPLVFFFLLTYLLSWWSVPMAEGALIPHGPALAAVLLLALTQGRQGLRDYWMRLTGRLGGWWYLVGTMLIVGYQGIALAANLWLGAEMVEPVRWLSLGILVQLLFFGGQWEEPGWTGYALPKLQERFENHPNSLWIAALILGVFRAIWHIPLLLYGKIFWFDVLMFSVAFQVLIAWLYQRSGRSVLVVMWFHFMSNVMGAILSPVFSGADRLTYYVLFMSLAAMFALALVLVPQISSGRKKVEAAGLD